MAFSFNFMVISTILTLIWVDRASGKLFQSEERFIVDLTLCLLKLFVMLLVCLVLISPHFIVYTLMRCHVLVMVLAGPSLLLMLFFDSHSCFVSHYETLGLHGS